MVRFLLALLVLCAPLLAVRAQTPTPSTKAQPAAPAAMPSSAAPRASPGPKLTVVLPADKASGVDPRIGRIVLLASEALAEAPKGTLVLETREGEKWVPAPQAAKGDYDARTRQWRWLLSPPTFPENAEVRATLKPQGGKSESGKPLPASPMIWTFKTTSASAARLQALGKGGCPIEVAAPSKPTDGTPAATALPCPK